jgi:hypothetical protein
MIMQIMSHADGARVDHVTNGARHNGEVMVAAWRGDKAQWLIRFNVQNCVRVGVAVCSAQVQHDRHTRCAG